MGGFPSPAIPIRIFTLGYLYSKIEFIFPLVLHLDTSLSFF